MNILKRISWEEEAWKNIRTKILEIERRLEASKEIEALLRGLEGKYIEPGPSGLITRGRPDVLPTGRNFYSLDPYRIPTPGAYEVGKVLAQKMIERYLEEEGKYPETVAIYWMCGDIMWSDGEGMGQILALLGVSPKWDHNGRVKGFEVIPLSQLGRPRIDVVVRVSGITRDNFPMCIELLDEAIERVALLDEPLELNFVRKHTEQLMKHLGGDLRSNTLRIFSAMPGTYRAGTELAVYASAWKEKKDLAEVFLYWNGYAYGRGIWGESKHREFKEIMKGVDLTFNKVVSDEYDLFGCCCYFGTHGGLTVTAEYLSGKPVKAYYGDTRDPLKIEVRDLAEEISRVVRTKLLNPQWIEGMKRHGYKGAGDISKRVGRVYGWEATTEAVADWIFDEIARTFLLNEENRNFFKEHNPYALEEIARRLLEAANRGLWNPAEDVKENLQRLYLQIEGWMEELIEGNSSEYQGGRIDIITAEEIDLWKKKMEEVLR